jgi:hypothetical protein
LLQCVRKAHFLANLNKSDTGLLHTRAQAALFLFFGKKNARRITGMMQGTYKALFVSSGFIPDHFLFLARIEWNQLVH